MTNGAERPGGDPHDGRGADQTGAVAPSPEPAADPAPVDAALHRSVTGRFAPSPSGTLHLGNLRTALASWCAVRGDARAGPPGRWIVRMEDLDPVTSSPAHEAGQLAHLSRLGMTSDVAVVRQSDRFDLYRGAIEQLDGLGLVYPCFCTRREIREAAAAPHGEDLPDGAYPGTCRGLGREQRARRVAEGRPSALRLRTDGESYSFDDLLLGVVGGRVDDVVLQRNDGVPAYNLAVVVDDHLQGVDQVVRGDDLAASTPRQLHLQQLLGYVHPQYAHLPLVVGPDGQRLAKRHGAVTLDDLAAAGWSDAEVLALLGESLGMPVDTEVALDGPGAAPVERLAERFAERFSFDAVPRAAWRVDPETDLRR